jgi:LuxR family transcriptional regulator, maltose regulon positive regulatory protein
MRTAAWSLSGSRIAKEARGSPSLGLPTEPQLTKSTPPYSWIQGWWVCPEEAVEALAPVIDGSAPALYERWARVEALLLDATARDRLGDRRAAEGSLEAALELAEPEGLVLPFMLWPSRELLEHHPKHRTAHATLISTILDALAGRAHGGPAAPLRDGLSDAELRVVRYLPSNLTAAQIASQLVVSANTVRTHMRHIYAKLDAHSRSEAVARARELGLVAPGALRR